MVLLQFCKNIVLAGVGSVTLNDDRIVTEELLSANFLINPDQNVNSGKSLAELCSDSLKEFNPMVRVSVEKGELLSIRVFLINLLLIDWFGGTSEMRILAFWLSSFLILTRVSRKHVTVI